MSLVDQWGEKADLAKAVIMADPEKLRDLIVVRLRASGQVWKFIGAVIGVSAKTAMIRWESIPEDVRDYYSQGGGSLV